jgi:hypothetical protein
VEQAVLLAERLHVSTCMRTLSLESHVGICRTLAAFHV